MNIDLIKKVKNNKGVSLIELIVAVTIFSFLMLAATSIFKMVIDGQRNSISAQNVQENIRYAMEKMGKEIRMAQRSDTACIATGVNKVFNTAGSSSELYFENKDGQCITYYLDVSGRLKITVSNGLIVIADDFITPNKIQVSNLKFNVVDNLISDFNSVQPYVTMVMDVKAVGLAEHEQEIKIQMTVSARYYE